MADKHNMKVVVGADTSPFDKGMAKVKSGLKDFDKVTQDTLSQIGNAIGVDVSKIQQYASALNGATQKMSSFGTAGKNAFSALSAGAKTLAAGIAGLGIAGAVAAFKQLVDQANNFKSLAIGDYLAVEADAFRQTVTQAMYDVHTETGRMMATWMETVKNNWTIMIQTMKGTLANLFSGVGKASFGQALLDVKGAVGLGYQAKQFAGTIDDINDKMSDMRVEWHMMDRDIAEYRRIATDATESVARRQEAIAAAEGLIRERYSDEVFMLKTKANLMGSILDLTNSTQEEIDAYNAAQIVAFDAEKNMEDSLRSLQRLQKGMTSSASAEAHAREAALAAMKKQGEQMAKLSQMSDQFVWEHVAENGLANIDLSVDQSRGLARQKNPNSIQVNLEPVIDKEAWLSVWEELNQDVKEAFVDIAETIGSSLVDAFQGGGVDSLMSGFLKTIGGFAKKFGAALMSFGLAETAFFKSLTSMNPATAATAVAAGAALVAVGAALSSIASSVGGSRGYSSSNVASSSYGGYSGESTYGRTMTVEVVGTLRANGSVLEAVINGENNRKQNVT